ncbi:MAG TPA: CBS domain-containing protein [Candidatus Acidoferrales bacterium]|nr:CBS domain-containing protein [Candidatus Acidoferrales bacterium]
MIHVTELLDAGVYDAKGNYVGRVRELCLVPTEQTNRVARLVIARGRYQPLVARYDQVASAAPGAVRLNTGELHLDTYHPDEGWLTVRKDVLDQQIIDLHGRKVVRVNDIDLVEVLINSHMELRLAQVDVGLHGALRRLLKGVLPPNLVRFVQKGLPTRAIPWEFVDLIEPDPLRRVKLKLPESKLRHLHPADIADIIEELPPAERDAVIESLDEETAAEALGEVKDALQAQILEELEPGRAAEILEHMPPDKAADVLAELPAEMATQVLEDMGGSEARELTELLQFGQDTAGGLMTPEVFASVEATTATQVVNALRGSEVPADSLDTIFLIGNDNTLVGAVPMGRLLLAPAETPLGQLRTEQLIFADTQTNEKQVIDLFDKYNLRSLPVVDAEHKLMGMISVDTVVTRLWQKQA